jgi:hypothetical protein
LGVPSGPGATVDTDLQRSQHAELGTLLGHHRDCDVPRREVVYT